MRPLDRLIQRWRFSQARRYLAHGIRLLDVGCHDGALGRQLTGIAEYVGIDPQVDESRFWPNFTLIKGRFPADMPHCEPFDAITMLAVMEHIPLSDHKILADACAKSLTPGGRLLITVPSPKVDYIMSVLMQLRMIDGIRFEEHYGYDATQTPAVFLAAQHELELHRRFEFGLNHLFVFRRRIGNCTERTLTCNEVRRADAFTLTATRESSVAGHITSRTPIRHLQYLFLD